MKQSSVDSHYTILLAEDDNLSRSLTERFLSESEMNLSVQSATNGKTACKMADKMHPDLILMDWIMPEMTGIEAVQKIVKNPATAEIPIIMLTASSGSEKLEEAFEAGAVDYVRKPFDKTELLARIKSVLRIVESRNEIKRKNEIINQINTRMLQSINYAANIQKSMRIPPERLREMFPDSFILFRPKDRLSGDFYWFRQIGSHSIVAAVDCTGHGVPGAFLSTIGHIYLDNLVKPENPEPNLILQQLHTAFRKILRQDETNNLDGMSISLCVYDADSRILKFSGANQDILVISGKQKHVLEGNIYEIGGLDMPDAYQFENQEIKLESDSSVFMFSDGMPDQTGGNENLKFGKRRLTKMLQQIAHLPGDQQKLRLERDLALWQGNESQMDDILIIGLKP